MVLSRQSEALILQTKSVCKTEPNIPDLSERMVITMVYRESFTVQSNDKMPAFRGVTARTQEIVGRSGIKDGIVGVYSRHTTCCVITEECAFDASMTGPDTLQQDMVEVFEKMIPTCRAEKQYPHPRAAGAEIRRRARRGRARLPQHRRTFALVHRRPP